MFAENERSPKDKNGNRKMLLHAAAMECTLPDDEKCKHIHTHTGRPNTHHRDDMSV